MSNKGTANNKSNVAVQNNIVKEYKYEVEKLLYTYDFSESMRKKFTSENTATPSWIVEDMIGILPDEVWTPNTKFLDIYCKSGIFLEVIMTKLMKTVDYSKIGLKDNFAIKKYIAENQLYGVCWNYNSAELARCVVNGRASIDNGIVLYEHPYSFMKEKPEEFRKYIREKFGNMKFDVLVGNPPYNKDIYLDFVTMSHQLASICTCMITPAKWQAKGGEKNEDFRANIVPYMSKIVYYPDCTDVFAIGDPGGISYYLIDKHKTYKEKFIKNVAFKQPLYNDSETRNFDICSLYNKGTHIANKVTAHIKSIDIEMLNKTKKYQVWSANKVSLVSNIPKTCLWSTEGMFNCLGLQQVADKDTKEVVYETDGLHKSKGVPEDSRLIFSSDSLEECKSFISYCYTRLVRYLLSLSLCGLTGIATSNDWWRFVPDPGAFDHIFTDEELYKKYNLTPEEINIIESVIKERK